MTVQQIKLGLLALCLALSIGCVSDDDNTANMAGTTGEGGEAGEAGMTGQAGEAGAGGEAGEAGAGGEAGEAGAGGAAGEAGAGGAAGEAGAGGEAGEAGTSETTYEWSVTTQEGVLVVAGSGCANDARTAADNYGDENYGVCTEALAGKTVFVPTTDAPEGKVWLLKGYDNIDNESTIGGSGHTATVSDDRTTLTWSGGEGGCSADEAVSTSATVYTCGAAAEAVCGNGVVEGTEACDDGNTDTETACADDAESCEICTAQCESQTLSASFQWIESAGTAAVVAGSGCVYSDRTITDNFSNETYGRCDAGNLSQVVFIPTDAAPDGKVWLLKGYGNTDVSSTAGGSGASATLSEDGSDLNWSGGEGMCTGDEAVDANVQIFTCSRLYQ